MVSGSRAGGNRAMDDEERKLIESIREIVGNHTDADIYAALKEADMNADEAVQKLIHQGLSLFVSLTKARVFACVCRML